MPYNNNKLDKQDRVEDDGSKDWRYPWGRKISANISDHIYILAQMSALGPGNLKLIMLSLQGNTF